MAKPIDQALRSRLLEAATREFAERGFGACTMAGIGAAAGVSKGGVYFHFRSKDELFFAALDHWRASLRLLLAPREGQGSGADDLLAFLREYLGFHLAAPEVNGLLRVLSTELKDHFTAELRQDLRQEKRLLRSRLREILQRGDQEGSLSAQDPALAAFLLASTVEGILSQQSVSPIDVEPFCDADHLAESLLRGYAASAEAGLLARPGTDDTEFDPKF